MDVKALEESCLASLKGVNGISKLLEPLQAAAGASVSVPAASLGGGVRQARLRKLPPQAKSLKALFPAVHALRRVFTFYLESGHMKGGRKSSAGPGAKKRARQEAGAAVSTWLHARLAQFLGLLAPWLHSASPSARMLALRTMVHFVAHGPQTPTPDGGSTATFDRDALQFLLAALLAVPGAAAAQPAALLLPGDVVDALQEEFADEYDDFRLFLLAAVGAVAADAEGEEGALPAPAAALLAPVPPPARGALLVSLLRRISVPPSEEAWGPRSFLVPPPLAPVEAAEGDAAAAATGTHSDEEAEEEAAYLAARSASVAGVDLAAAAAAFGRAGRNKQRKRARAALAAKTGGATAVKAGSLAVQHRGFQGAWLAALRLPLPRPTLKVVLGALRDEVLPTLPEPLLLADFLTAAYNAGGGVALLALEGLWHLMTEHGLQYPAFYTKLYALLTPGNLRARFKTRFMQLLDMFLSSAALPAYLVAAFAKRLARLAVTGPPPSACLALPLLYNLLKRHPACTQLLHRAMQRVGRVPRPAPVEGTSAAAAPVAGGVWADPFHEEEGDPAAANALGSQLWEVLALQAHFVPQVARLASLFSRAFTRGEFSATAAASNTFASLAAGAARPDAKAAKAAAAKAAAKPRWHRRKAKLRGDSALAALGVTPLAIHTQDSVGDAVRGGLLVAGAGDDGWEGNPYFLKPLTADEPEDAAAGGDGGGKTSGEIMPPPMAPEDSGDEGEDGLAAAAEAAEAAEAAGGVYGAPFKAPLGSVGAISAAVAAATRSVNLFPHIVDCA